MKGSKPCLSESGQIYHSENACSIQKLGTRYMTGSYSEARTAKGENAYLERKG